MEPYRLSSSGRDLIPDFEVDFTGKAGKAQNSMEGGEGSSGREHVR